MTTGQYYAIGAYAVKGPTAVDHSSRLRCPAAQSAHCRHTEPGHLQLLGIEGDLGADDVGVHSATAHSASYGRGRVG